MIPALISTVLAVLVAIAMIASAIIAHRGKKFWGSWMMLGGGIGLILGTTTAVVASYLLFQSIAASIASSPSASSGAGNLGAYSLISGAGALLTAASLLSYIVGLLGLCVRYGAFAKRINDLETINSSLISQQEQSHR